MSTTGRNHVPDNRHMVSLRPDQFAILKRLAAILSPSLGKPATYGEAIEAAERICSEHLGIKAGAS
jgi:hypothetical protein